MIKRILGTMVLFAFLAIQSNAQDKTATATYNVGLNLLKAKDYAAGLPLLEEALTKAEAEGNEKVIKLAKKNGAKATYNLGNAKKKAGANDEAIALFEKGIAFAPDYASNYRGLAAALEAKGEKIKAIEQYIESGNRTKDEAKAAKIFKKAQNMVGKIYQAKEYSKAIEAGQAFLAKKKDNAEVNYYICRAITESEVNEEAIKHIDEAITLSGASVDDKYYVAKAKAYEKMSKNAEAVEAYKLVTGEKYKEQAEYKIKTLGGK